MRPLAARAAPRRAPAPSSRARSLPLFAALAAAAALAPRARAAPPVPGASPTAGVLVPVGNVAGDGDATSIETDPANLGFMPAWSAIYLHTELDSNGVRGGRGDALYLASPVPYLDMLSVGFAAQSMR